MTSQNTLEINIIPYKSEIKYIYHLSDIHIHLYKRHSEYETVFNRVLEYLRNERKIHKVKANSKKDISLIIIITGDILHSKSDLSPECISITYKFIKDLLDVMPVIIIPGNHDLNMNNKERLDSLTPIICDLPQYYPIHYLSNTGVWLINNIILSHASIFDYQIINPSDIDNTLAELRNNKGNNIWQGPIPKIILYHGRVNGAELFNGSNIQGETNLVTKKTITPTSFTGYDMALLGDIHKMQFIDDTHTRAYAGSLIQQNLGEDLHPHGLLKWNIETNTATPVYIKNDYGYVTFNLINGKCDYFIYGDINGEITGINPKYSHYPPYLRMRILYYNTTQLQIEAFITIIKSYHTILEYSCQNDESLVKRDMTTSSNTSNNIPQLDPETGEIIKPREVNINDINYQNELLAEIIRDNLCIDLEPSDLETIKNLNKQANELFNDTGIDDGQRRITFPGQRYKLTKLEFDNLFSYSTGNIIDFTTAKGVVGIVAANHMGKSAILDIILYGLFDKFTRKGNIKDMINNRKQSYRVKLTIQSGVWIYIIEKTGERTASGTSKNKCLFTRINISTGREENLARDTGKKTRDYICEIFGNFEDMLNTNFSIQTNSTGFIDADNSARRNELERILRFDFISELAKHANDSYKNAKTIFDHLQKTMPPEKITQMTDQIKITEDKLISASEERQLIFDKVKLCQENINQLNIQINPEADKKLDNLLADVDIDKTNLLASGTSQTIIKQINDLELHKTQNKLEWDDAFNTLITLCTQHHISYILDESPPGPKAFKKFRESIRVSIKTHKLDIQTRKTTINQNITDLNQQIRTLHNTKSNYIIAKPHMTLDDINNLITHSNHELCRVGLLRDELTLKETELDILNAKLEKYNSQLEDQHNIIDNLLNTEKIPDFILQGYDVENYRKLKEDITAIETIGITNTNYPELYPLLLNLGHLEWIKTQIKTTQKTEIKLDKARTKLEETKLKITNTQTKLKTLQSDIKKCGKVTVEFARITEMLDNLAIDLQSYNTNITIQRNIDILFAEETTLRNQVLDNSELNSLEDVNTALTKLEELDVKRRDIKTKLKALGNIQEDIDNLITVVEKNNSLQKEIVAIMDTQAGLNDELSNISATIDKYKDSIAGLKGQLEKMRQDCVEKIQQEKLMGIYAVYRDALKLMPILLIAKIQPLLERKVNDLLGTVTDFCIKFSMEDSKIDIYLDRPIYHGEPILINNSSGFERFISSLAIRIALMEISQLPSPNFMAIDEGWSCFDNENIANIDTILEHLGQKFDFILTISHLQIIRQHCDVQIGLRKDTDGFSNVTFF